MGWDLRPGWHRRAVCVAPEPAADGHGAERPARSAVRERAGPGRAVVVSSRDPAHHRPAAAAAARSARCRTPPRRRVVCQRRRRGRRPASRPRRLRRAAATGSGRPRTVARTRGRWACGGPRIGRAGEGSARNIRPIRMILSGYAAETRTGHPSKQDLCRKATSRADRHRSDRRCRETAPVVRPLTTIEGQPTAGRQRRPSTGDHPAPPGRRWTVLHCHTQRDGRQLSDRP